MRSPETCRARLSFRRLSPLDSIFSHPRFARRGLILESNHLSLIQRGWYRRRSDSWIIYRVFLQRQGAESVSAASRRFAHQMNSLRERASERRVAAIVLGGILSISDSQFVAAVRFTHPIRTSVSPLRCSSRCARAVFARIERIIVTLAREFEALSGTKRRLSRLLLYRTHDRRLNDWHAVRSRPIAISRLVIRKRFVFVSIPLY